MMYRTSAPTSNRPTSAPMTPPTIAPTFLLGCWVSWLDVDSVGLGLWDCEPVLSEAGVVEAGVLGAALVYKTMEGMVFRNSGETCSMIVCDLIQVEVDREETGVVIQGVVGCGA